MLDFSYICTQIQNIIRVTIKRLFLLVLLCSSKLICMEEPPSKVPTLAALALATIKKELKTPKMIEALNNATPSQQNVIAQTMSEGLVEYKDLTQESSCSNFCSLLAQQLLHKIVLPHCLQTPVCYDAEEMKKQFYFSDCEFFTSPRKIAAYGRYMNLSILRSQKRWDSAFCGENRIVFSIPELKSTSNDQTIYNCVLASQSSLNQSCISMDFHTYKYAFIIASPENESCYFVVDGCSEPHKTSSKEYPYTRNLRKCERGWRSKDKAIDLSSIEGIIHDGICLPDEKIVLCEEKEIPENKLLKNSVQIWLVQPSSWRDEKLQKLLVINSFRKQDMPKLWPVDDHTFAFTTYEGIDFNKKLQFFDLQKSEFSEPIKFTRVNTFFALDSHVKSPNIVYSSSNGKNGTVLSAFDKVSKTTTPLLEIPESLQALKLSPDGQFCVGLNRETVYLFDLFHKLILARFSNPCESGDAPTAISNDSKRVLLGGYIWDIEAFHYLNNPSICEVVGTMRLIENQKGVPSYLPGRCSSPQEILKRHLFGERQYKAGK